STSAAQRTTSWCHAWRRDARRTCDAARHRASWSGPGLDGPATFSNSDVFPGPSTSVRTWQLEHAHDGIEVAAEGSLDVVVMRRLGPDRRVHDVARREAERVELDPRRPHVADAAVAIGEHERRRLRMAGDRVLARRATDALERERGRHVS